MISLMTLSTLQHTRCATRSFLTIKLASLFNSQAMLAIRRALFVLSAKWIHLHLHLEQPKFKYLAIFGRFPKRCKSERLFLQTSPIFGVLHLSFAIYFSLLFFGIVFSIISDVSVDLENYFTHMSTSQFHSQFSVSQSS